MYVWDIPRYSPTEAGRIVGLSVGRVRRWLLGYQYETSGSIGRQGPVVARTENSSYASFLDLIDLLFVKRFLEYGFSLQKIRKALAEAREIVDGHHFAQRSFMTDGENIYLKVVESAADNMLQLFTGGQWVIAPFIKSLAKQIDFDDDTGFADKWYPNGKNGRIVLDPRIAFGAPTITGKGIRTSNVYDFYRGENDNVDVTSSWMNVSPVDVRASVKFEESMAA